MSACLRNLEHSFLYILSLKLSGRYLDLRNLFTNHLARFTVFLDEVLIDGNHLPNSGRYSAYICIRVSNLVSEVKDEKSGSVSVITESKVIARKSMELLTISRIAVSPSKLLIT